VQTAEPTAVRSVNYLDTYRIKEFLNRHADIPTTANRCKRVFSTLWNCARGWKGYTSLPNPVEGIKGHKLKQRSVYVTDQIFNLIKDNGSESLRHGGFAWKSCRK
jgi:hypothetical protein